MRKPTIVVTAAALLLTSAPVLAQEVSIMGINVSGSGRGWKLQPQRGPDGQNVYRYNCVPDFRRMSRHRVSYAARPSRMIGR